MPISKPAKKQAGRKKMPKNEKLVVVSFGISADELKLLEMYQKEYGFKNLSVTIRKIIKEEISPRIKYVYVDDEKLKQQIKDTYKNIDPENLVQLVLDTKKI